MTTSKPTFKIRSKKELEGFTTRRLTRWLFWNKTNRQLIVDILAARFIQKPNNFRDQFRTKKQQEAWVEAKNVNPYYEQIPYPGELHELASHMKKSGWRCKNMKKDPKGAYDWVRLAIEHKRKWSYIASLPASTQQSVINFWSAAVSYWEIWQKRKLNDD